MNQIPNNKICVLEDFSDKELMSIIQEVFKHEIVKSNSDYPNGIPNSKKWEIAMSIRAFNTYNILHRDSTILGVGAGTEVTLYYLTKLVKHVFATDLYLNEGVCQESSPFFMLIEPENFAPYDYEHNRLIVQHMDGRWLQFPDNYFDGIFSHGLIENFDSLDFVSNACYEMGRVLKPGGILSLSTKYKINGPSEMDGWDSSTLILSREKIMKYIVEASGLEMVDDFDTNITKNTMLIKRKIESFIENSKGKNDWQQKIGDHPDIILVHNGYVFCSANLTLCKPNIYPRIDNSWAKPNESTKQDINRMRDQAISAYITNIFNSTNTTPMQNENHVVPQVELSLGISTINMNPVENAFNEWQNIRLSPDTSAEKHKYIRKNKLLTFIYRTILRIRKLGKVWEAQRFLFENYNVILQNIIWQTEEIKALLRGHENSNSTIESLLTSHKNTIANQNTKLSQLDNELDNSKMLIADQTTKLLQLNGEINDYKILIGQLNQDFANYKMITNDLPSLINKQADEIKTLSIQYNQRISDLDFQIHLISSHLRYIENKMGIFGKAQKFQELVNVNGSQLVDFVKKIEGRFPELASEKPVEIFISPLSLEEPLFVLVDYFGDRINPFQNPSIIYYFNFSSYHDDVLQKSSISQLSLDGYFVQVSTNEIREIEGAKLMHFEELYLGENRYSYEIFKKNNHSQR